MTKVSPADMIALSGMISMESHALAAAKAMREFVETEELKTVMNSAIDASESRLKQMQVFANENNIISGGVH